MFSIGLDLSMVGSGICVLDVDGKLLESATIETKAPKEKGLVARFERVQHIVSLIESTVLSYSPCKIAIEGHSHGSGMRRGSDGQQFQQRGGIDRHELFGAVVHALLGLARHVALEEVPPKSLKKFWCSNGNAKKDEMGQEADRRGFELKYLMPKKKVWVYKDNEVDALALAFWAKENL